MPIQEFLVILGGLVEQFSKAVGTGAQWEIFAQSIIADHLKANGQGGAAREIKYPGSAKKSVDIAFGWKGACYLVELKVESATNAGVFAGETLKDAITADKIKLAAFDTDAFVEGTDLSAGGKWVVAIAYSAKAKKEIWESTLFSNKLDKSSFMFAATSV
ncbi:MAG TPA: hypothetical protein VFL86_29045 [Burkholderiaceae bacterium]|nr:hypothetical protein [Burkholderiaceae bacterium]